MNHTINNLLTALNNVGELFYQHAAGVFVQSALLVIVLYAVDLLLRKRVRAVFRYCVWLLVLVKLVLPPTLSLPTGVGYWAAGHLPSALNVSSRPLDGPGLERPGAFDEVFRGGPSDDHAESGHLVAATHPPLTALTWQAILFILWLVGVLAFLALLIQRARFVRALIAASNPAKEEFAELLEQCRRQIGVRSITRLRISDAIPSPAVCGFFRPTIVIPAALVDRLSPEGLRAILIHELAHIKRGDLWINSIQTFLQIVYFYNPFVWFANSVIRRVCEEAVDETVMVTLGGQAENYSNTLIDIGEMAFWRADLGLRLVGVAESRKALQWRIRHMLTRPMPKSSKLGVLGIAVLLVIAITLLPMARAQEPSEESTPISGQNQEESTKSLHQAAADGDIEQVKLLISSGADVNEKDENGRTALHSASEKGHAEVVKSLISQGAYANAMDRNWAKPLHYAAMLGDKQTVELLISEGADINAQDKSGRRPWFLAMRSSAADRKEVVELLVARGAELPALHLAAYMGDMEKLERLLKRGINVNTPGEYNTTALHAATNSGKKDIVEFLINKGANVDARDTFGLAPLYYAALHNYEDIADLLLDKGTDINAKDKKGYTLLYYAIWDEGDEGKDAIKLLISKGANVNEKDTDGFMPLNWAIWLDYKDIVELLINEGADVNAEDKDGLTPYYWAAIEGRKDIVELLTAKGATPESGIHLAARAGDLAKVKSSIKEGTDIDARDKRGQTPLFGAVLAGNNDVAKFLLAKGADVNAKDSEDKTPLYFVVISSRGKRDMVELLISKGADVNAKNNRGVTPLHTACARGQEDVAELLIAKGSNVNTKTTGGPMSGRTPLDIAAIWGRKDVAELLIAKGADINSRADNGDTPLNSACLGGHKDVVELLIAKGADMNAKDNKERTALASAKHLGHEEIVKLLLKHGARE